MGDTQQTKNLLSLLGEDKYLDSVKYHGLNLIEILDSDIFQFEKKSGKQSSV
jgi:hypothetical protein